MTLISVLAVYGVMSVVSVAQYGWDKFQAGRGGWRVPEKRLLAVDLLGGWPGGLAGQTWFRHKTQKAGFRAKFWGVVSLHVLAWGAAGVDLLGGGWLPGEDG